MIGNLRHRKSTPKGVLFLCFRKGRSKTASLTAGRLAYEGYQFSLAVTASSASVMASSKEG